MADGTESELAAALRTQVNDLIIQVTQLNTKLVSSYDRVSDLEDSLHISSSQLRQSSVKINEMELEREKHRSMIEGGLLVEKAHVTQELSRLMVEASLSERKGEEDRSKRQRMEKELDDLSAGLFEQANNMVREARMARDEEVHKKEFAETALTSAEELTRSLQGRLGELTTELELVQSGNHPIRQSDHTLEPTRHLLSTSQPYTEFLLFIAHLRTLHPSSHNPPSMSTLLSLPWLSRVGIEDVDPTLRLDLAPALNWLSRRSVLSAIHSGSLVLEPITPDYFNEHTHPPTCALCGIHVLPGSSNIDGTDVPLWSVNRFKKSLYTYTGDTKSDRHSVATTASSQYSSPPPTPPRVRTPPPVSNYSSSSSAVQFHVFRVPSQLPSASATNSSNVVTQTYTLCTSGTCFIRLRTACSLFTYIRNEVVGGIWKEEIPTLPVPEIPQRHPSRQTSRTRLSAFAPSLSTLSRGSSSTSTGSTQPAAPQRKRSLWGTMQTAWGSVSSSAPSSPTQNSIPLPQQPSVQPPPPLPPRQAHKLPPLPPKPDDEPTSTPNSSSVAPPPLPQRSLSRKRTGPSTPIDEPDLATQNEQPPKEDEVLFDHNEHEHDDVAHEPKSEDLSQTEPGASSTDTSTLAVVTEPTRSTVNTKALDDNNAPSPSVPSPTVPPPIPRRAANRVTTPRPISLVKAPIEKSESTPAERLQPAGTNDKIISEGEDDEFADASETLEIEKQAEDEKSSLQALQEIPETEKQSTVVVDNLKQPELQDGDNTVTSSPLEDAAAFAANEEAPSSVDRAVTPRPLTPTHVAASESVENVSSDSITSSSTDSNHGAQQQGGIDPGLYISSRTWEERTWKELNRLREDMFWSRSGGVLV